MFDRTRCGIDLGPCAQHGVVHFTCPKCGAKHDRGYINGVDAFRCLGCGYVGYGLHPDADIDHEVYQEAVVTR